MQIRLDYGATGLMADLPDSNVIGVLRIKQAPAIVDAEAATFAALNAPVATAPLRSLAHGRKNACIVICDVTRPVPNRKLLPPVLKILEESGLSPGQISILIATGTHRPNLGGELANLIGEEIAGRYRVINHNCRDLDAHRYLGASPNGVPVYLDSVYCNSDLKITIGLIEPHFMAGYSGGRKLIMPGVAAFETIKNWHCPRFLESPFACSGTVENNPVHAEALAIAKLCPPDCILDVTLDERNEITGIFAGDMERAWLEGAQFAERHVKAQAPREADIVVTSCAGAPLDATFYQAVKGMVGAMPAVKAGGDIIIAAECAEGLGSSAFADTLLQTGDLDEFLRHISQPGVFVDEEWEVEELARATRHATITCVSGGIPRETLERCFVLAADTVEMAVAAAMLKHGPNASILAIPRGPYVIPYTADP